jgi:hypothetical protein
MTRSLPVLLIVLVACAGTGEGTTTSSDPVAPTTTLVATSTTQPPVECPPPPYEFTFLPQGVGSTLLDPATIEPDVWTSVPGISATLLGREDGSVGVALIRGTLPAVEWPGERGEVFVDGTRGVVGPHPDGTWVAGWYEAPGERCDLYTLVAYPDVAPSEVEMVIDGLNRVGG